MNRPTPTQVAESLSQRLNITEFETRVLAMAITADRAACEAEMARVAGLLLAGDVSDATWWAENWRATHPQPGSER